MWHSYISNFISQATKELWHFLKCRFLFLFAEIISSAQGTSPLLFLPTLTHLIQSHLPVPIWSGDCCKPPHLCFTTLTRFTPLPQSNILSGLKHKPSLHSSAWCVTLPHDSQGPLAAWSSIRLVPSTIPWVPMLHPHWPLPASCHHLRALHLLFSRSRMLFPSSSHRGLCFSTFRSSLHQSLLKSPLLIVLPLIPNSECCAPGCSHTHLSISILLILPHVFYSHNHLMYLFHVLFYVVFSFPPDYHSVLSTWA